MFYLLKYRKAPLKPVVGFSLSKDFTDVISMDLKEVNGHKILHLIDHATCYSAATTVNSKQKEEILGAIFEKLIAPFGAPNDILNDNRGEFKNDLLREMAGVFNVLVRTTSAESP